MHHTVQRCYEKMALFEKHSRKQELPVKSSQTGVWEPGATLHLVKNRMQTGKLFLDSPIVYRVYEIAFSRISSPGQALIVPEKRLEIGIFSQATASTALSGA